VRIRSADDDGTGSGEPIDTRGVDIPARQGVYRKPGHQIVVVPNHRGDLSPGTLRSICAAAGWEYPPQP
jgi:hypothetical protein